jgi:hypothetical protein
MRMRRRRNGERFMIGRHSRGGHVTDGFILTGAAVGEGAMAVQFVHRHLRDSVVLRSVEPGEDR